MEATMIICPICKEIKTNTEGATNLAYHSNSANFKTVQVNIFDGANAGMMMGGSSNSKSYTFKPCNDCCSLPSTDAKGLIAKLTEICETIKASDETLKASIK